MAQYISTKNIWNFSPQTIPGLMLWLDGADSSSITTGSIFTWRDKSVNVYNATQYIAGNQPTVSGNGLVFTKTANTYLTTAYTAQITSETIFAVVTPSSSAISALSTFTITSTSTTSINIGSRTNTTTSLAGGYVSFSALSSTTFGLALNTTYYVLTDNWVSGSTSTITLATLAAISTPISTTGNITSSTSTVGNYYNILGATAIGGRNVLIYNGKTYLNGNSGNQFTGTTSLLSTMQLLEITYSGASTGVAYLNGLTLAGSTSATVYASGGTTTIGGTSRLTTNGFDGTIYEIICYNSVLTTQQRQQVEGYLLWKWNLQANSLLTHPYNSSLGIMPFSRAFTPIEISGLSLWLDAADASTITGTTTVTQWNDKSSNGYNAIPNLGNPSYSSTGLGGLPTISITSSGNMRCPVPAGTFLTGFTLFVIFQKTGANNAFDTIVSRTAGSIPSPFDLYINNSTSVANRIIGNGTTNGSYQVIDTVFRTTTPTMYYVNIVSTAQTKWNEGVNGVITTYTTAATTYGDTATAVYIGTRADGTTKMNGNISEIIMYNTTLTTQQRQQIEGYLANKWNLTSLLSNYSISLPTNITGCVLWLDAADSSSITLSGSNVTTWNDKSGIGNNATAVSNPTLSNINGVQAMSMNNAPYFTGNISITGTTYTCFAVAITTTALPNALGHDQRLVSLANGTNLDYNAVNSCVALFNQGNTSTIGTYRNNIFTGSNAITRNVVYIAVSQYDGTKGYLWQNGIAGTTTGVASTGTFAITKYGIGNQANPSGEFWVGNIGEIIIYNTALSTSQRQQVEGYLASKWNVSITPTVHPFRNYPPSTITPFNPLALTPSFWFDASTTSTITSGNGLTAPSPASGDPLCFLNNLSLTLTAASTGLTSLTLTGTRLVNTAGRVFYVATAGGGLTTTRNCVQYYILSDTWVSGTTSTITISTTPGGGVFTTTGAVNTTCTIVNYWIFFQNNAFEGYNIAPSSIEMYVRTSSSYGINQNVYLVAYPVEISTIGAAYAGYLSWAISAIPPRIIWNDWMAIATVRLWGDGTVSLPAAVGGPVPFLTLSGSISTSTASKTYNVISVAAAIFGFTAYTLSISIGYVSNPNTTITFSSCSSANNGTFNIYYVSGSIVIVNNVAGVLETNSIGTASFTYGTSVTIPITVKPSSFGLTAGSAVAITSAAVTSGTINTLTGAPSTLTLSSISSIVSNAVTVVCTVAPSTAGISVGSLISISSSTTPCLNNGANTQSTFSITSTSGTSIVIGSRTNTSNTLAGLSVMFTALSSTTSGLILNKSYYILSDNWTTGATSTITLALTAGGTAISTTTSITSTTCNVNYIYTAGAIPFMISREFIAMPISTNISSYSNVSNAYLGLPAGFDGGVQPNVTYPQFTWYGYWPILTTEGNAYAGTSVSMTGTSGSSSFSVTITTRSVSFPQSLKGYLIYFSALSNVTYGLLTSIPYYILSDNWTSGNTSNITLSSSIGGVAITLSGTITSSTSTVYPYILFYGPNFPNTGSYSSGGAAYITSPNYWTVTALSNTSPFSVTFNMYGNIPPTTGTVAGTITALQSPNIWAISSVDNTNKTITFNTFNNIPSGTITTAVGLTIHATWRIGDKFSTYSNGQYSFIYKTSNINTRYGPFGALGSMAFGLTTRFYQSASITSGAQVKVIVTNVDSYLIGLELSSITATGFFATYTCATDPAAGIKLTTNGVTTTIGSIITGSVVNIFGYTNTSYNISNAVVLSTTSNSIKIASTLAAGTYTSIRGYMCLQNNPFLPESSQLLGWKDRSGNGCDLIFSQNAMSYGTTTQNGLSALSFNSQIPIIMPYSTLNRPTTNDFSIFGVFYINANSTIQQLITKGVAAGSSGPYIILATNTSNQIVLTYYISAVIYTITSAAISSSGWYIVSVVANRSTNAATSNYIKINGTTGGTFVTPSTGSVDTGCMWSVGGSGFDGNIGEIIYVNTTISIIQCQQMEGYLAKKWGIALPTTHPYYKISP